MALSKFASSAKTNRKTGRAENQDYITLTHLMKKKTKLKRWDVPDLKIIFKILHNRSRGPFFSLIFQLRITVHVFTFDGEKRPFHRDAAIAGRRWLWAVTIIFVEYHNICGVFDHWVLLIRIVTGLAVLQCDWRGYVRFSAGFVSYYT